MHRWFTPGLTGLLALAGAAGCGSTPGPPPGEEPPAASAALTPGSVKMNIVKGRTTQTQVLEAFGTPELVTHKDGRDVWTYDRTTFDYRKQSGYLTVLFAGTGGDRVQSSSRSTMLILYFDEHDVVSDYRLSALKF